VVYLKQEFVQKALIGYKRGSAILVPMFNSDLYDLLSPVGNEQQIHEQID